MSHTGGSSQTRLGSAARRTSRAATAALCAALGTALAAACAETNAPLPEPVESLLVVNRGSGTLRIIPVDQPAAAVDVPLGAGGEPSGVVAQDSLAVVPVAGADVAVVIDLRGRTVLRSIALPPGSGASGAAIVSDSAAYIGNPDRASLTRINLWTGDTAEVEVGGVPEGLAFVRGQVFALNGQPSLTVSVEPVPPPMSWLTIVNPATNARASGIDSIPLTGIGGARFATVGGDGLLYTISAGAPADDGRLSLVDPVGRAEVASFAGFGTAPGDLASDGERIFVSSRTEGLMVFDIASRTVTRGAGNGVPISMNSAVAVDSRGRIYAIEAGSCTGSSPGVAHVLDENLVEVRTIPLGDCPSAATIVKIPQP